MRKKCLIFGLMLIMLFGAAACRSQKPRTVKGQSGAELRFAWTAAHERPGGDPSGFKGQVVVDSQGGAYQLDQIGYAGSPVRGLWLRKYSPRGEIVWTIKRLPEAAGQMLPQDLAIDSRDNIFIAASARGTRSGAVLEKLSPDGRLLWRDRRRYKPGKSPRLFLTFDDRGGIYLAGTRRVKGTSRPWAAKYQANGKSAWEGTAAWTDYRYVGRDGRRMMDVPGIAQGIVFYNNQLLVAAHYYPKSQEGRWNADQITSYDSTGRPTLGFRFRPEDGGLFHLMAPMDILASIAPKPGNNGYAYTLAQTGSLSVWLTIDRNNESGVRWPDPSSARGSTIKAALAQAPERPGDQFAVGEDLAVDKQGNAYVVVLQSGDPSPRALLFKIEARLPSAPADKK